MDETRKYTEADLVKLTPEVTKRYSAAIGDALDGYEKETGVTAVPFIVYLAGVAARALTMESAVRIFIASYTGADPDSLRIITPEPETPCGDPTCACAKRGLVN